MALKSDISGQKFGRLLVVRFHERRRRVAFFECLCDCGNTTYTTKYLLVHKKSRSCGCLRDELKRTYGTATANTLYSRHKYDGKHRGLGFLSRREWDLLVYSPCYYCGQIDTRNPSASCASKKARLGDEIDKWDLKINGVDRLDPKMRYTRGNCVACCGVCNIMKNSASVDEFEAKIYAIYKNRALEQKGGFGVLDTGLNKRGSTPIRPRPRNNGANKGK